MKSAIYSDYDRYREELKRRASKRVSARVVVACACVAFVAGVVFGPAHSEASREAPEATGSTEMPLPNKWRWNLDAIDFDHMFRGH